jgi:hypothetical protein
MTRPALLHNSGRTYLASILSANGIDVRQAYRGSFSTNKFFGSIINVESWLVSPHASPPAGSASNSVPSLHKTPNRLNYMSWEDRYQQLLDYKEEFGHCLVPQAYLDVGSWVHQQRIQYKRFVEGKACVLNEDKIEKLKDAGFVFLTRHRSKPKGYDDGNDDDDLRQLPNHLKTAQGGAQGNCSSESSDDDDDETRRNRLVFEATQPHQETTFAPRVPRHRHV